MNEQTVLIIEDDKTINNFLSISLKTNGYRALSAEDGVSGLSLFLSNRPDVVLLDLGLPDLEGIKVLEQIRLSGSIPVIVISARGQEREKIALLDAGADDYVTKPFSANELMARIRVVLRHALPNWKEDDTITIGELCVDCAKRKVTVKSQDVHLTPLEFKMVTLLMRNPGKVLTHRYIQHEVWGYETDDDYQTLRVFMANIRRKIEEDTSKPRYIITEMGVGYRFADE